MGALGWILSIVGVLGVGGFAAALIFAPPLAAAFVKIALNVLERILSTRIGVGIVVGIACSIAGFLYGEHEGAAGVQAKWDAAEQRAIQRGSNARETAEQEIPPVVEEPRQEPVVPGVVTPVPRRKPVAAPDWMRNDPDNRDNDASAVRPVAKDTLQRKR